MSLSLQFLSALIQYAFLNEIYQPEGHLLWGWFMQGIPSKFQDRCICNSLDRQFFQPI